MFAATFLCGSLCLLDAPDPQSVVIDYLRPDTQARTAGPLDSPWIAT